MRLRGGGITRSITVRRIASAASASSGRSRSTARASRRSRSSATARSAGPSCTSCASASARPRPCASAAPTASRRRPRRRRPRPRPDPAGVARCPAAATLTPDGRHRPDPPLRAPPLERGPDPRRRRRRGRRRARPAAPSSPRPCHAARLPPDPGRPRLEDAVDGPARAARAADPRRGPWRSASARRRSARSTSSTSTTPPISRCAGRSPGSAATTTSSSTATGSPASRPRSGRTRTIVDGDAKVLLDRVRVDRRQGRPRPDDDPARGALSGLRLGAQPGLRDPRPPRRDPGARA